MSNVVLEFGDYRLDIARRELRRDGDLITLEPKVFDLLAFLVQNRDRVVSKDDLLQAVWGGRVVSDSALAARINGGAESARRQWRGAALDPHLAAQRRSLYRHRARGAGARAGIIATSAAVHRRSAVSQSVE